MIIYKYLPPESALKTVTNNSVLLRSPLEYNDPFDCLFFADDKEKEAAFKLFLNYKLFETFYNDMVVENKKPTRMKTYAKVMKSNLRLIGEEIKRTKNYVIHKDISMYYKFASKVLGKKDNELKAQFKLMIDNVLKDMRKTVLASCFGSTYDSLLMWSHYADKHKGACIEFEIDDKDFKPINYSEDLPVFEVTRLLGIIFAHQFLKEEIDMEKEEYQFALKPLLTKANVWSYEGEIRCVYSKNKPNEKIYSNENGDSFLKMPPIKRIFVGCNAEEQFVKDLIEASNGTPVKRMKMASDKYSILI